jgi:hypothetical protein
MGWWSEVWRQSFSPPGTEMRRELAPNELPRLEDLLLFG